MCHAKDGKGLPAAGFPPLAGSEYVTGDYERLVLITTKGLQGPIELNGKTYNSAMPGFQGRLSTRDMQALFAYIRNAWGNQSNVISESEIEKIIEEHKDAKPMPTIKEIEDLTK